MSDVTSTQFEGVRVAFLATDGVERRELTEPWAAVRDAGAIPVLVSPAQGSIRTIEGDREWKDTVDVDVALADADAADFAALVLPGGTLNADALRIEPDAVTLVRAFLADAKTVAAICHAPWLLIEADAVGDRRLTSYTSLRTDLVNAGAHWVDEAVVTDDGVITSRNPGDLDAFATALLGALLADH